MGYYVVWSVTPALHTPLMSVTNAISLLLLLVLLLLWVQRAQVQWNNIKSCFLFCFNFASINIFGGFLVTQRMLKCIRKGEERCLVIYVSRFDSIFISFIGVFLYLLSEVISETARIGNYLGMSGMLIAFTVTILNLEDNSLSNLILIVAGISIGGLIGTFLSKKVAMTDMLKW